MKIFKDKNKLQKEIFNKKSISFIPTMGGLHKGHIQLIKKSKKIASKNLISIFVNPKQFNNKNDFMSYPRTLSKDLNILQNLNVNYVYLPSYKDIYSFKPLNEIYLDKFANKLCGKTRKGHFEGVLNVVNRLLEIIKPKYMLLGIKDFQQLYLIKSHVKKKGINTKIISCKTIREVNKVACSTRNNNISKSNLIIASKVYHYLKKKKKLIKKDFKFFNYKNYKKDLFKLGVTKIDYIKVYDINTLKKPLNKKVEFKIFVAYYLDKVRLIDNI